MVRRDWVAVEKEERAVGERGIGKEEKISLSYIFPYIFIIIFLLLKK